MFNVSLHFELVHIFSVNARMTLSPPTSADDWRVEHFRGKTPTAGSDRSERALYDKETRCKISMGSESPNDHRFF